MLRVLKVSFLFKPKLICLTLSVLLNSIGIHGDNISTNHYVFPSEPVFVDEPSRNYSTRTSMEDCAATGRPERIECIFFNNKAFKTLVGPGEFSHMVAIGWTRSDEIVYACGGILISHKYVLTVAHCGADDKNIPPDHVRAGDTDLQSPEDDEFIQRIKIARFTKHPKHRWSRSYYDIALIELQNNMEYSKTVCSACLWREKEVPREKMNMIGFGRTGVGEKLSPVLQRIELSAIDKAVCKKIIPANRARPDGLRKNQFCAAGDNGDACDGDSGGPLGMKRIDTEGRRFHFVVGLASFGTPCTPGSTGVYTKVSGWIDWIEHETNTSFGYRECMLNKYCAIVGGEEIIPIQTPDKRPRFGLLWDDADITSEDMPCDAALIHEQYFMTSASCVTSSRGNPKYVSVRIRDEMQNVSITNVYVSPKYRTGHPENDIALVKISKYVNTSVIAPDCLWNSNTLGYWRKLVFDVNAIFYGKEQQNGKLYISADLRCDLKQKKSNNVACFRHNNKMMPGLCTINPGSPVRHMEPVENKKFIYGLVSPLTKDCALNLYVTDVTPHIEWIESTIIRKRDQFLIFSD